ncbi:MAG: DoxX family protein [Bacteroidales bacterium]|nr:DoxX family protein [Bacteroidales bacterium]
MNTRIVNANFQMILNIIRVIVGVLFVFSGVVKCIDPLGGAIKIEDYFVAWGLTEIPMAVCITLSVIQNILEFIVGYSLLFKIYVPLATIGALLFMLIFTPLTLYIAIANPVSDCGCFGDAVKISNWQTFYKNLLFLPMTVLLVIYRNNFNINIRSWKKAIILMCGLVIGFLFMVKGLTDEPVIDFRPYSIGTNIREAMSTPEDAPQAEYKTTFILQKDGIYQEFDENNYPYNDSTWVYVDTHTEVIDEGYVPPIKDFTLIDRYGEVVTDDLLNTEEQIVLVVSPKLNEVDEKEAEKVAHLKDVCDNNDLRFYILTASTFENQQAFSVGTKHDFDYLQGDETMLKTIVRAKAGVIVMQKGNIVAKYHINHIPLDKEWKNPAATYLRNINRSYEQYLIICIIFALALIISNIKVKFTIHKTL